jgi:MORN repeat
MGCLPGTMADTTRAKEREGISTTVYGVKSWPDYPHDTFEGEWRDGEINGYGVRGDVNGVYEGEFIPGPLHDPHSSDLNPNGYVVISFNYGIRYERYERYEGEVLDGVITGNGMFFNRDGSVGGYRLKGDTPGLSEVRH